MVVGVVAMTQIFTNSQYCQILDGEWIWIGYYYALAYDPSGVSMFHANAVNNIRSPYQAGLGTEVFMTPLLRSVKQGDGLDSGHLTC
ncbi:unnamed protein product [Cylicocyclus nassatus]|uniref:Uncharacterized protein n=1 Tax=Cylicocyclus nassatus TaxID=53992 RepID=A0AA36DQ81_CYLNA|nr:unnamed protein product [Cylicocyclus nassatus]